MDFLDPKKRRAHTIRLFIGYGLVAVALLIGTAILALAAYGFDVNRKTGAVIQNGLVFVDAHPESANIYINGMNKGKTDVRMVMPEGNYSIELKRTGYRSWKNTFQLGGGLIERLVYPFLFPEKLITKDVHPYVSAPGLTTQSPDRHWLLIQSPASFASFDQFDLTTANSDATSFSLPPNLLTASTGAQSLELVEWSTDNRHLIVKHLYQGGLEYLLIDRTTSASSQNLTRLFSKPNVQFSLLDKKYDQYYLYDPVSQNLASSDLKTKKINSILDGVISFKPHGSNLILYVTNASATDKKVLVRVKSGQDNYTVGQLAKADKYLIDVARFDNHWYMVAGSPADGRTLIYRDPSDQLKDGKVQIPSPFVVLKQTSPQFVSFSENTRFIEVQSANLFAVYDLETDRSIRFDSKLPTIPIKAVWMDGHRLMAPSEGKLVVFDFDGTNKQTLVDVSAGYLPFFDRDYKALFTISPSATAPGKSALVRTELKVTAATAKTSSSTNP